MAYIEYEMPVNEMDIDLQMGNLIDIFWDEYYGTWTGWDRKKKQLKGTKCLNYPKWHVIEWRRK